YYDPRDSDRRPGNFADEVLVHELVHAMRAARGLFACLRPPGIDLYYNEEEFFAVLIANIFRAGWHRIPPRAYYTNDFRPLTSPAEFYKDSALVKMLITKLWTQQNKLVRQLAVLDYYFNPIRDLTGPSGNLPAPRNDRPVLDSKWPTVWT